MRLPAVVAIAAAALLAVAATALAAGPPNPADLEAEIVCPTCKTTLDQSNSPIATRMKAFIRERIAAGAPNGALEGGEAAPLARAAGGGRERVG